MTPSIFFVQHLALAFRLYTNALWAAWIVGVPGLILYYVVAVQYLDDARRVVARG